MALILPRSCVSVRSADSDMQLASVNSFLRIVAAVFYHPLPA